MHAAAAEAVAVVVAEEEVVAAADAVLVEAVAAEGAVVTGAVADAGTVAVVTDTDDAVGAAGVTAVDTGVMVYGFHWLSAQVSQLVQQQIQDQTPSLSTKMIQNIMTKNT
jgi:hypothetical protein